MTDPLDSLQHFDDLEETELVDSHVKRPTTRVKTPSLPKGATRSPHFNPQGRGGAGWAKDKPIVKQPPVLERFLKPLKPVSKGTR